jgi:hypothetical protein
MTDVRVTLDQDVWWRTRDGVFHLVDDLDDSTGRTSPGGSSTTPQP